jgi:zinc/manganese transport system ATP-binding protein
MRTTPDDRTADPAIVLRDAGLTYGTRALWQHLDLTVAPGEFLAVLGPNGSGKTSLIRVLLGLTELSSGSALVCGAEPRRGSNTIGYVPQQKGFDRDLPVRGADLVGLGLDGHRWGIGLPNGRRRRRVAAAVTTVGATAFAGAPIGRCSGGEQQRLRIAQALVGDPGLLLSDEPLLSLDLKHQRDVVTALDRRRRDAGTAVVFITHEINPILPVTDRVLYLVGARWAVGTPDDVLTGDTLSELYRTQVDVVHVQGRIVIVGAPDAIHGDDAHRTPADDDAVVGR